MTYLCRFMYVSSQICPEVLEDVFSTLYYKIITFGFADAV